MLQCLGYIKTYGDKYWMLFINMFIYYYNYLGIHYIIDIIINYINHKQKIMKNYTNKMCKFYDAIFRIEPIFDNNHHHNLHLYL